tara:strand:- start:8557 stop:8925 length:369 start_codon:yes stop_codon:yes gene_type:complete
MAIYNIKFKASGRDIRQVTKTLTETLCSHFSTSGITVEKEDRNPSRAARLDAIRSTLEDAKSELEELAEEMQSWFDGLPEGLDATEKAEAIELAAESLTEVAGQVEEAVGEMDNVEFPGMFS